MNANLNKPAPLPKAGSASSRTLWSEICRALDLPRLVVVLDGALDRRSMEELLQKLLRGGPLRPGTMAKPELVGRLADVFASNADAAYSVMRSLDDACNKERHIIASITEDALLQRLATYRAIDFRRERARLVWALLRDGRAAHVSAANAILDEAFQTAAQARENDIAVSQPAPAPEAVEELKKRLDNYESALRDQAMQLAKEQQTRVDTERERSEFLAKIGQRERALREEEQIRRQLEQENSDLRDEVKTLLEQVQDLQNIKAVDEKTHSEMQELREKVSTLESKASNAAQKVAQYSEENQNFQKELQQLRKKFDDAVAQYEQDQTVWQEQIEDVESRLLQAREDLTHARRQIAQFTQVSQQTQPAQNNQHSDGASGTRVGVFVDAANLSASIRRVTGNQQKLNFSALLRSVVGQRRKETAIAFIVHGEQQEIGEAGHWGFVQHLRAGGYEVREKRPKVRADGSRKADWDMGIAMAILDAVDALDVVVLCSGDGDFLPLVQRLQRLGKRVEVASVPQATEESLRRAAQQYYVIDESLWM